jgi:hypothetical protein
MLLCGGVGTAVAAGCPCVLLAAGAAAAGAALDCAAAGGCAAVGAAPSCSIGGRPSAWMVLLRVANSAFCRRAATPTLIHALVLGHGLGLTSHCKTG